jgi:amidohydrolase
MVEVSRVKDLAKVYYDKVLQIRRHLHQHPELSFQEFNTSAYIAEQLTQAGIAFTSGYVKTGIIAIIEGKNPKKRTLLLRADMDALPIYEKNEVEYKSKNEGVMHACGHDVHSSCVLGACFILNDLKDQLEGTIKIMFQPGEEVLPGGAKLMIEEGVLEQPTVHKALALHVFPSMEVGRVGFKSGMYMASTDELYLTVNGKGGHAAMPTEYINPLLVASEIILEFEAEFMSASKKNAQIPTVVAFGKIEGKGATNVIPDKVLAEGTFRTMNENWRVEAHNKMQQIVKNISDKYEASASLEIKKGYPFLVNDTSFTNLCNQLAKHYLGENQVDELPMRMTAEDFAFISQKVPSCFFRLGTGNASKGITSGVHTPTFNIDESALEIGMGLLAYLAIKSD